MAIAAGRPVYVLHLMLVSNNELTEDYRSIELIETMEIEERKNYESLKINTFLYIKKHIAFIHVYHIVYSLISYLHVDYAYWRYICKNYTSCILPEW